MQLEANARASDLLLRDRCGYAHGRYAHGRYAHGRYAHGRYAHGRYAHGRYAHGRYAHGAGSILRSRPAEATARDRCSRLGQFRRVRATAMEHRSFARA